MRRALTFVIVALGTAAATSAWLYDGDLAAAVSPVLPEWNADELAAKHGIRSDGIVPAQVPLLAPPGALPEPSGEPSGEPDAPAPR